AGRWGWTTASSCRGSRLKIPVPRKQVVVVRAALSKFLLLPTPKGSPSLAQGRAAHPGEWEGRLELYSYPEGVAQGRTPAFVQPLRGRKHSPPVVYPGCAARPWAFECDPFGVAKRCTHTGKPCSSTECSVLRAGALGGRPST